MITPHIYTSVHHNMVFQATIITITTLLATGLVYLVSVTYQHRSCINELRKQGFPMPDGWSWFFGNSFVLLRYTSRFPPLANIGIPIQELCKEFADTEMFLLDFWPSYPSSIVVCAVPLERTDTFSVTHQCIFDLAYSSARRSPAPV
ncbi:hypothetical protein BDV95DRAFT_75798 [Massariosphaeria phaeospora]|uniref:Uncharacterized protein n=1 Tax=Massariosphaeria phaeospora TaxID=100035 RepID=A0A7C8M4M5_9PLEO|nr:hypothetical protein BDV95DRAFT_75798 [Massariosphaeria phaeospora]